MTDGNSPAISDQVAINTIIGFAICLVISLATIYALIVRFMATLDRVPSSSPGFARRLLHCLYQHRSQYAGGDGLRQPHYSGRSKSSLASKHSRIVGQERMILLLLAAIFHAIESVSNFIFISSLRRTGNANFPFHFGLRAITVLPAGPLTTIATARRISIIVVTYPTWRIWFMRIIRAVCLTVMLVLQSVHLLSVAARIGAPPRIWLASVTVPPWTSVFLMTLPVVSIGSSLWALKIAFMDHHQSATSSSAAPAGGSASGSTSLSSSSVVQASSAKDKQVNPNSYAAPPSATSSLHSRTTSSHAPPPSTQSSSCNPESAATLSATSPTNRTSADPLPIEIQSLTKSSATANAEPSSLQYSLNLSFKVLSVLMTIWYIMHSMLVIFQEPLTPLVPMRLSALTTNVAALAVATEAGFEWLLKTSRLRRKRKKRREQIKKASGSYAAGEKGALKVGSGSKGEGEGVKVVGTALVGAIVVEQE